MWGAETYMVRGVDQCDRQYIPHTLRIPHSPAILGIMHTLGPRRVSPTFNPIGGADRLPPPSPPPQCFCPGIMHTLAVRVPARIRLADDDDVGNSGWGAKAQEEAPSPTRPGGARDVGGSNGSAAPGGSAGGSKTITVDGGCCAVPL